jgi:hypothetical protein
MYARGIAPLSAIGKLWGPGVNVALKISVSESCPGTLFWSTMLVSPMFLAMSFIKEKNS